MGRKKKPQQEPVKTAAWDVPVDTAATVKAYALAMGITQNEVVSKALAEYLRRVVPASGKKAVIQDLAKTYGK